MDLRTKICLWVIVIGMANFLAYTIGYTVVGGESVRGKVYEDRAGGERTYELDNGQAVGRGVFIYMGVHSIVLWISVAAVMLAMLTLAKDRIADSMQSAAVRGRTFCTVLAVVIGVFTGGMIFQFIHTFVDHFQHPIVRPADQTTPPNPLPPSGP
ncbi:MAG: hypothetical protein JXA11_01680 [Phycisphaerae bacterium]|nr:hypothetical protein [Phycisphaerae bacterium]